MKIVNVLKNKHMTKYIVVLIFFAFMACKSSEKAIAPVEKTNETTSVELAENLYRFNVSFISIGSGTDKPAIAKFEAFLAEYEAKNKIKLVYQLGYWGREGEVDYCFKLKELDDKKQLDFINSVKESLKESKRVRYKENSECPQKSR